MVTRKSLILMEKARRQVFRGKPREAVLGDENGNIYAGDGMYWARWPGSADENGNATYSPKFRVFGGAKNFIERPTRRVYIKQNHKGQYEIDGPVYEDLQAAGIKPSAMHPNNPYRAFTRLDDIQNFKAIPVTTSGMKVRIGELFYVDRNGIPRFFPGSVAVATASNPAVHVDLTSYRPATGDFECFALISFNQDEWAAGNNPLEVSVSTAQTSLPPTLEIADIQEAFAGMSEYAMPIKAFHLINGMTALEGSRFDLDVRQIFNVPLSTAGSDSTAIHVDVDGEIDGLTEKVVPVAGDWLVIEDSEDGNAKKKSSALSLAGVAGRTGYILIQDQKTQNTPGGTFAPTTDVTRVLNTIVTDTTSTVSLSTNQFTLQAGTYRATIQATSGSANNHQAWLYNVTDAAIVARGTSSNSVCPSVITIRFTIAGAKAFEVRHRCASSSGSVGFGYQSNLGTEIYTTVLLEKE